MTEEIGKENCERILRADGEVIEVVDLHNGRVTRETRVATNERSVFEESTNERAPVEKPTNEMKAKESATSASDRLNAEQRSIEAYVMTSVEIGCALKWMKDRNEATSFIEQAQKFSGFDARAWVAKAKLVAQNEEDSQKIRSGIKHCLEHDSQSAQQARADAIIHFACSFGITTDSKFLESMKGPTKLPAHSEYIQSEITKCQ